MIGLNWQVVVLIVAALRCDVLSVLIMFMVRTVQVGACDR